MSSIEYDSPLDAHLDELIELREVLLDDVEAIEAMLDQAEVDYPGKEQPEPKKAPAKKKNAKNGKKREAAKQVSEATRERVLLALRQLPEPGTSRTVADMLTDLSPSTVSKAMQGLVAAGQAQEVGVVPNVRGRRPLFAAVDAEPTEARPFPPHEGDAESNGGAHVEGEEVPGQDERHDAPVGS